MLNDTDETSPFTRTEPHPPRAPAAAAVPWAVVVQLTPASGLLGRTTLPLTVRLVPAVCDSVRPAVVIVSWVCS